jgi:hypothetical protein
MLVLNLLSSDSIRRLNYIHTYILVLSFSVIFFMSISEKLAYELAFGYPFSVMGSVAMLRPVFVVVIISYKGIIAYSLSPKRRFNLEKVNLLSIITTFLISTILLIHLSSLVLLLNIVFPTEYQNSVSELPYFKLIFYLSMIITMIVLFKTIRGKDCRKIILNLSVVILFLLISIATISIPFMLVSGKYQWIEINLYIILLGLIPLIKTYPLHLE